MNIPVNIGLSPNLEWDDFWLAIKVLLTGGDRNSKQKLVDWFENYFSGFNVVPFNSGRSSEWAIIKALNLSSEDEVLVQDFTCIAVPNSVHWAGAKTVDVKIKAGTYNMDPSDLEKKITNFSKAVMVQHTFGQAAEMSEILAVCRKYNLLLIEDCAHALGASYDKKPLGTIGDIAFFSLGRDKAVSSIFGGVVITKDKRIAEKLKELEKNLPENSGDWVIQQLFHPILTWMFLPIYNTGFGKVGLWLSQKLGLLSKAVYEEEKRGLKPNCFPAKYSNKLAELGLNQLKKLQRFNAHRKKIAQIYFKELSETDFVLPPKKVGDIYLRFTVTHPRARELYLRAKLEKKWILGDWYKMPNMSILNLPTYPSFSEAQARELSKQIKIWLKH
jgi:dTDP-4-amino-4,6-dideoxygalactose transaminase